VVSRATIHRILTGPVSSSRTRASGPGRRTCGSPRSNPTSAGNPTSPTTASPPPPDARARVFSTGAR
jgi:hypothetical protein